MPLDLPALLGRVYYRYPSYLIDAVTEHEPGNRLVAFKNVTVSEEFFQGHFPGSPLMPAVLMIEALTQVAAVLVLDRATAPLTRARVAARRQQRQVPSQVVPGDRLRLEVHARAGPDRAWPRRTRSRVRGRSGRGRSRAAAGDRARRRAASIRPRTSHPAGAHRRGHRHRAARDRSAPTSASARTAGLARRSSSTAGPRSATRRRSSRWRRSAWRRRISSIAASDTRFASGGATSSASS